MATKTEQGQKQGLWGKIQDWYAQPGIQMAVGMVYSIGAAVVIVGALFKIQHWPGAGVMLTAGMLTEAIHTPLMQDRYLAIENAQYIFNNCRHIGDEVEFKKDGIIQRRAQEVLAKADALLEEVEKEGLFQTIEKGIFGGVKRPFDGGHGLEGVCSKGENYFNPFIELFMDHE